MDNIPHEDWHVIVESLNDSIRYMQGLGTPPASRVTYPDEAFKQKQIRPVREVRDKAVAILNEITTSTGSPQSGTTMQLALEEWLRIDTSLKYFLLHIEEREYGPGPTAIYLSYEEKQNYLNKVRVVKQNVATVRAQIKDAGK